MNTNNTTKTSSTEIAKTVQEGATSAYTSTAPQKSEPATDGALYPSLIFQTVLFFAAIIVTIYSTTSLKRKIEEKEDFEGLEYGILAGVFAPGILWALIIDAAASKKIEQVRSKKYQESAKEQMHNFRVAYWVCMAIWVVIVLMISSLASASK